MISCFYRAKNNILPDRVLLHVGQGSTDSLSFSESCFLCPTAAVMVRFFYYAGKVARTHVCCKYNGETSKKSVYCAACAWERASVNGDDTFATTARRVKAQVSRAANIAGANGPVETVSDRTAGSTPARRTRGTRHVKNVWTRDGKKRKPFRRLRSTTYDKCIYK